MKENKIIRILIAKVGCDIHERGALTLMNALKDAGMEVIYAGRYQTPDRVAKVAAEEDVDIIALSDHTGSLPIIAASVKAALKPVKATDIPIIAGGLLTAEDVKELEKMGVSGNYGPGTPLDLIIHHVKNLAAKKP